MVWTTSSSVLELSIFLLLLTNSARNVVRLIIGKISRSDSTILLAVMSVFFDGKKCLSSPYLNGYRIVFTFDQINLTFSSTKYSESIVIDTSDTHE